MYHALKKKVTIARGTASGELHLPPEVASLRLKLASVKRRVVETVEWVEAANARAKVRVSEQAAFGRAYSGALGGDGGEVGCEAARVARAFADQAALVYKTHCRAGSPDPKCALYKRLLARLKAYVAAVERLEARYPRLVAVSSETSRYNAKFDSMLVRGMGSRGVDDLKVSRNLEKSDSCRGAYRVMRDEVLAEQRALFERAPVAMKAAIVLYWGTFERTTSLLQMTFQETDAWARENVDALAAVNVSRAEHMLSTSSPALSDTLSDADPYLSAPESPRPEDIIPNKLAI